MEQHTTTLLTLLLLLLLQAADANRLTKISNGHPTDFLVSSLPGAPSPQQPPAPSAEQEQEEVQSMTHQLMERLAARGADPSRPSVRYILDLFEKLEQGADLQEATGHRGRDDVINTADVIRGIAPTGSSRRRHKADVALSFPLSGLAGNGQTELAELRIRPMAQHPADTRPAGSRGSLRPARRGGLQRVRVSVVDKDGDRQLERVYRVRWRLDQEDDFDVLDVTRILQDMVASGAQNFQNGSLEISLRKTRRHRGNSRRTRSLRNNAASGELGEQLTEKDAMMVVYSKATPETEASDDTARHPQHSLVGRSALPTGSGPLRRRTRRGAGGRKRKNLCAAKDMYVDFATLGWADDIIFPTRYNARTCSGKCPSPVDHSLHPTNHAILQSMMRLHDRKTPRPCCVPTALKPLMMLYKLSDGNIEIRHHPDMVVDQCGCR